MALLVSEHVFGGQICNLGQEKPTKKTTKPFLTPQASPDVSKAEKPSEKISRKATLFGYLEDHPAFLIRGLLRGGKLPPFITRLTLLRGRTRSP